MGWIAGQFYSLVNVVIRRAERRDLSVEALCKATGMKVRDSGDRDAFVEFNSDTKRLRSVYVSLGKDGALSVSAMSSATFKKGEFPAGIAMRLLERNRQDLDFGAWEMRESKSDGLYVAVRYRVPRRSATPEFLKTVCEEAAKAAEDFDRDMTRIGLLGR